MLQTIGLSILGAILVGLLTYFSKLAKGPQVFDPWKLGRIAVMGFIFGVVAVMGNFKPTMDTFHAFMLANASLSLTADQAVKLIWRLLVRGWRWVDGQVKRLNL